MAPALDLFIKSLIPWPGPPITRPRIITHHAARHSYRLYKTCACRASVRSFFLLAFVVPLAGCIVSPPRLS